ncbi:hypothetical protein ACTWP5_29430 [Streptomyces sp. 4N509B]|uniref:hypothetical protein n=1 Tax=Streptomyces sp. 4N509B TaxID=3457413 RepID=UPI003FD59096
MLTLLLVRVLAAMERRWKELRRQLASDGGYTTETVVITALLAILGITAAGILTMKVVDRANGIDLEAGYDGR